MCNFLFTATITTEKDMIVKIFIDLSRFFSLSFLVINFHQTGSSNRRTFSKHWKNVCTCKMD